MEYIVYLTTNIINNKIYVGVHGTNDSTVFDGYIGNSVNIFQSNPELKNPKVPFHKAVKKYGYNAFKRAIIKVFNNEQDALDLEAEIVNEEFIKRNDTYNITLGGGMPPLLNKTVYQYSFEGNFIKEWNSLTEAGKSLNISPVSIGRAALFKRTSGNSFWSFYKFETLDTSDYKKYSPDKPVYIYNEFGLYERSFESMSECARFLNDSVSHIQRSIKTGVKTKGYYIALDLMSEYVKPKSIRLSGMIHQYDLEGNYIQSFDKPSDLKARLNIDTKGINNSIRLNESYKGFLWVRGEKVDKLEPHKPAHKSRKIGQYSMDGTLVKVFNTVREARKEFPNVSKVLNGTAKHCHNYFFKYLE